MGGIQKEVIVIVTHFQQTLTHIVGSRNVGQVKWLTTDVRRVGETGGTMQVNVTSLNTVSSPDHRE